MTGNYNKNKAGAFRVKKTQKFSRLADKILSPSIRRQGFVQNEIIARWPYIVGRDLAESVVPLQVRFPRARRNSGTLIVRCESAFAPALQHRIPDIIESINGFYGYAAVEKISIQHGKLPKAPKRGHQKNLSPSHDVVQKVEGIINETHTEGLKSALKGLGEQIYEAQKRSKKN